MKVKLVKFNRANKMIEAGNLLKGLNEVEIVGPYGFLDYLKFQYQSNLVISDSGTAQEECPLLQVPVVVPRKCTERPESIENGNSILVGETNPISQMISETLQFYSQYSWSPEKVKWLGEGDTSQRIVACLKETL